MDEADLHRSISFNHGICEGGIFVAVRPHNDAHKGTKF